MLSLWMLIVIITLICVSYKLKSNLYLIFKNIHFIIEFILARASYAILFKQLYLNLKSNNFKSFKLYLWLDPLNFIVDRDLIKSILQNDHNRCASRGIYFNGPIDDKPLRAKLTPIFTSSKVKQGLEQTKVSCKQMVVALTEQIEQNKEVDIQDLASRYVASVSASYIFGLESHSFEEENPEFARYATKLFTDEKAIRNAKLFIGQAMPSLAKLLGITFAPPDVTEYFLGVMKQTVAIREQTGVEHNDLLKLMMDLKGTSDDKTIEEVIAQALIFFIAGFKTSNVTIAHCLFEVAKNDDIQDRLKTEIELILAAHDGELNYEAIEDMNYLGRVVAETLRKYPLLHCLTRRCTEDYPIPGSDTSIKKSSMALISVLGVHYDPEYYPNPENFDPDRFLPEIAKARPSFAYLPFGGGPKICTGYILGLLQVKLAVVSLLMNFRFSVSEKTVEPLSHKKKLIVLVPEKKIYLNVEKL